MFDKLHEDCAVAAVYGNKQAAELCMQMLYMLQHRGPQASGVVSWDGTELKICKAPGLVREVLTPPALERLPGRVAIGHNRYNTCGGADQVAIQPHIIQSIAGASNGDVPRYEFLRQFLLDKGFDLKSHNDGEAIVALVAHYLSLGQMPLEAIRSVMAHPDLVGAAYSSVFIINDELWVFRDPFGFRPLSIARYGKAYVAASETVAYNVIGADYIRDIKPGEIYRINSNGGEGFVGVKEEHFGRCVFELIYFARPDSKIFGWPVSRFRKLLGARHWETHRNLIVPGIDDIIDPVMRQAKLSEYVVVPVPDSANSIAKGFSEASDIAVDYGLVRNHYTGRGFLEPAQDGREDMAKYKYNPDADVVGGKRVILVDDSIVRGTTLKKLVRMLRNAGAIEVIILIGSPPYISPCFFGIDTPTKKELSASSMTVEEICTKLEADKLFYLTIDDLKHCLGGDWLNYCMGCFTGQYIRHDLIPDSKLQD